LIDVPSFSSFFFPFPTCNSICFCSSKEDVSNADNIDDCGADDFLTALRLIRGAELRAPTQQHPAAGEGRGGNEGFEKKILGDFDMEVPRERERAREREREIRERDTPSKPWS